jgi:GNAT superfamily N-acetyltransferase
MAGGGSISRIVSALESGAGVVTSRGDVHYVVTEYGIAQLWGKSIRERAAALIEIAHPDVRPDLLNEAKRRHYLLPDHPLPNPPGRLRERLVTLRTGEQVRIRPVRVSDEDTLQELLYRLSDESTFFRFFGHTVTHPHREVLELVELDGACGVALVAESMETEELLGIARADLDPRSGVAELGVTVADTWHNKGLGSLLLESLEGAARTNGFQALAAAVLPGNGRMQRLLRRRGFTCSGEPMDCPLSFTLTLHDEAA